MAGCLAPHAAVPAPEPESHAHAGLAKLIGGPPMFHRARDDHSADAQGGDALGVCAAIGFAASRTTLKNADHGRKDGLECPFRGHGTARYVRRQGDHRTRVLDIFEMLMRKVGAHDLTANVGRCEVDLDPFPAVLPIRIGEKTAQDLDIQIAFALKVTVETAAGQVGAFHNLIERDSLEAMAVKETTSARHDALSDLGAMAAAIGHVDFPFSEYNDEGPRAVDQNMFLIIFSWHVGMSSNTRHAMTKQTIMMTRRQAVAGVAMLAGASLAGAQQATMEQKPASSTNGKRTSLHQEIEIATNTQRIFDALLDSAQFAAITGMPAEIDPKPGGAFKTFGGLIEGRNVELTPGKRIVQAWRPAAWDSGVYSVVRFELRAHDAGALVVLDHTGFPEGLYDHLYSGWYLRYWDPMKKWAVGKS